ncbi:hypothetical protein EDD18DRAFT_1107557 [Armillaria luteobubalina]|uniref:Uncharacterized protein n=1 Tax=Armillaria luteobubalina TaxID=153913 RepID=A0AA39Q0W0_9AGAR|nr:hypothetical protein EDD18DRAFT_1107557 [Armillaria luteobubalina]
MVARLRATIQFAAILLSLRVAALPASHIYRRDDDPSSTLPDPDENQDIQSVRDYMQKSIQAYLATQNTKKGATFIAETSWRAIVVDTTGIGDDSDSDSAGTDVMTGDDGSSAGEDVMTGNVDGRSAEGEGPTDQASRRDVNEDEEVYDGEEWWKRYSSDDDSLLGSALVDREGAEFEDVGSGDASSGDKDSEDSSSGDADSEDSSSGDTDSGDSSSGDSSSSSNDDTEIALANNDIYHLFDKASPSKSDHINFFSDQYIQFTKEIGDIFSGEQASKEEAEELQKLAQLQSTLCTVQLTDVTDKAYYSYERSKKYDDNTGNQSSQDFKTWAATDYTDYMLTYEQCQLALRHYNTLADKIFGKFRGPINAALNKIAPLDSGQVNVPGVTMMLGSGTGSLTGQGNAVPYYALPGAKGTVAAWRKQAQEGSGGMRRRKTGSGDGKTDAGDGKGDGKGDEKTGTGDGNTDTGAGGDLGGFLSDGSGGDTNGDTGDTSGDDAGDDTASEGNGDSGDTSGDGSTGGSSGDAKFKVPQGFFSYSSSSKSGSVEGETDNGGGSVGLDFKFFSVGAGADTTTSSTSTELKMKSFNIAWQAALLPVQRGTWFDGFRVASLMSNLGATGTSANDDENDQELYANATDSFDKWFGTSDQPGPGADYNDIALIIYHPIFEMEFSDEKTYQEYKETKASAGETAAGSSNKTTFSQTSSTVTYEDLSKNVYYAGSLQGSFWTQSSDDSDSSSEETQVEKRRLLDWSIMNIDAFQEKLERAPPV